MLRKVLSSLFILIVLLTSCGPKPMYKTREGKRKHKYYDMHQYDRWDRDLTLINEMEKPKKKKDKKKRYNFEKYNH